MFIGALSPQVIQQFHSMLSEIPVDRVYVCCSGSFRSERAIHQFDKAAEIISNDVSLYSCALGHWLADKPLELRFTGELEFLNGALDADPSPLQLAAVVGLALEMAPHASGKRNPHKQAHLDHLALNPRFRRSIAKRATGTLTAGWPDVLAASRRSGEPEKLRPSNRAKPQSTRRRTRPDREINSVLAVGLRLTKADAAAGSQLASALPLLGLAEAALWKCVGPIQRAGDSELGEAVLDVIRILGRRRKARQVAA